MRYAWSMGEPREHIATLRAVFQAQAQTPFLATVFDAFAKAQCPTLVLLATRNIQQAKDFGKLMAAGRRGVERDLMAAAASRRSNSSDCRPHPLIGMSGCQVALVCGWSVARFWW
jgi:hypothetical protein